MNSLPRKGLDFKIQKTTQLLTDSLFSFFSRIWSQIEVPSGEDLYVGWTQAILDASVSIFKSKERCVWLGLVFYDSVYEWYETSNKKR